ncbi:MAG: hypothetical protein IPN69_09780 [Acidobacteria bacterium]|nr:hypothetical protein [Acidobacteriota bacterium]
MRQGYGLTENDPATDLNHTWFRKNENRAGRWTSPDPYNGSASVSNPQSWNRYSYVENQPTNFVDPSGLNAIGGFYVCYDIVTTGGYPNQPGHVYTTTETVCFVFGGGNPGVGTIDTGGGIGGGIGGAAGPKDDRDECYKKVEADYSKPPSASSEEIHRFTAQMNAVEATHKLALDGATIKASNTLYYAVLAAAGGFMAGALFTKNVWGAAVGAVVAGGFTLATQATDIQLSRDQAWKAYKIATGLARTLNPNAAKRERFFDQKRAALRKCDSLYPPNRFWKITSPLNA